MVGAEPVGLIGAKPQRFGDDPAGRHELAQRGDDLIPLREDIGFRLRQSDHGKALPGASCLRP
jgi:hypothetical protein